MATCEVTYMPKIPAAIIPADRCSHMDINVGAGIQSTGKGKQKTIAIGAQLCLCCGRIKPVDYAYRHYFEALGDFWVEFGWHSTIGPRLQQFASAATETEFEAQSALSGFSPQEHREWLSSLAA